MAKEATLKTIECQECGMREQYDSEAEETLCMNCYEEANS